MTMQPFWLCSDRRKGFTDFRPFTPWLSNLAAEQDPGVAKDMAINLLMETYQDQEVEELFTNVKTRTDIITSITEQHASPQSQDQNLMVSMTVDITKIMAITRSDLKNIQHLLIPTQEESTGTQKAEEQ